MKRKIVFIVISLVIFVICFTASVKLRDYFYERSLRNNIQKIKVGMSEKEVFEILGKPSLGEMSDISGEYWCYDTDSIARTLEPQPEIRCGHLLLEMSAPVNGRVVKVFDFDR
jgi:outer membrane protein assembly factor BamE (lipoprotein component of BamABCDE complex)